MINAPRLLSNIDITDLAKKHLTNDTFLSLQNKKGRVVISSILSDNTKLSKGKSLNYGFSMLPSDSIKQYLKPEYQSLTLDVCPKASDADCKKTCLGIVSGMFSMHGGSAFKSLIKKALIYFFDYETFFECLDLEVAVLASVVKRYNRNNNTDEKAYIRLDVFSDNKAANMDAIEELNQFKAIYNNVVWYDYTKLHSKKLLSEAVTLNYNLALSVSRSTIENSNDLQRYIEGTVLTNYSAVVVSKEVKKQLLDNNNLSSIAMLDGDIFDTFTEQDNPNGLSHQWLLLEEKAASKANKKAVNKSMSLTYDEVENLIMLASKEEERVEYYYISSLDL